MKILKTMDDAIKEISFWKESYKTTLKELLEYKAKYQHLLNCLKKRIDEDITTLNVAEDKCYQPRHARNKDEGSC